MRILWMRIFADSKKCKSGFKEFAGFANPYQYGFSRIRIWRIQRMRIRIGFAQKWIQCKSRFVGFATPILCESIDSPGVGFTFLLVWIHEFVEHCILRPTLMPVDMCVCVSVYVCFCRTFSVFVCTGECWDSCFMIRFKKIFQHKLRDLLMRYLCGLLVQFLTPVYSSSLPFLFPPPLSPTSAPYAPTSQSNGIIVSKTYIQLQCIRYGRCSKL